MLTHDADFCSYFVVIAWAIWKDRNALIFSKKLVEPSVVVEKALEYLSEYQLVNNDNEGTNCRRADRVQDLKWL